MWDPDEYRAGIRDEIHDYDALQEQVAQATLTGTPGAILELGTGAGETAARVLEAHPGASLTGIDSSPEMLRAAAESLPAERVTLLEQDLADPLPAGPFDLAFSALAVHHLDGPGKQALFGRLAGVLSPGGIFVLGDVVVPDDPRDVLIENEPGYDMPSRVDEQLTWLTEAGFVAELVWSCKDLAVIRGRLR
jgi:tRNA (cmo5U34)-methyltransferase